MPKSTADSVRVLLVDDEPLARNRLKRFVGDSFQVFEAVDGRDALQKISEIRPHIVFLDIQMPGMTGMQVLQNIQERNFSLVFQTAYDEYAIQAFEENACDYLLKPFSKARFDRAMSKAVDGIDERCSLGDLEQAWQKRSGYMSQVSIRSGNRIHLVPTAEISHLLSQDHYTCIYTKDGNEWVSDLSISHLEKRLDPGLFQRVHRNALVRLDRIESARKSPDRLILQLCGGVEVLVSRARRKRVLESLN